MQDSLVLLTFIFPHPIMKKKKRAIDMKYIFFDIDGTLVDTRDGQSYLPESTKKAIRALQTNGYLTAIASGRSMNMVLPVAQQLGIENIVSDGGYGVMHRGKLLHISPLEQPIVQQLCQELIQKNIPFAIMTDPQAHIIMASSATLSGYPASYFQAFDLTIDERFDYRTSPAYKVFMGVRQGQEDRIETVNAHQIMRYFEPYLAFEPDDKYRGVKELAELEGVKQEDLVFFGDGKNDVSLFKQIPFSIAMGNAIEPLKKLAYFVTKPIDQDGIAYACKHFHWISESV